MGGKIQGEKEVKSNRLRRWEGKKGRGRQGKAEVNNDRARGQRERDGETGSG